MAQAQIRSGTIKRHLFAGNHLLVAGGHLSAGTSGDGLSGHNSTGGEGLTGRNINGMRGGLERGNRKAIALSSGVGYAPVGQLMNRLGRGPFRTAEVDL